MLVSDGSLSFVIFLYADGGIQWTTGDASGGADGLGGTPALAGVNAGDGDRQFNVSESLTDDIINISTTSNIGVPGVWIFQVNGGELSMAPIYGNLLCGILCYCAEQSQARLYVSIHEHIIYAIHANWLGVLQLVCTILSNRTYTHGRQCH